jgi:hypothetical protein
MPTLMSPFRLAGRLMADQCRRLHATLESLAAEVRAAIARAVGQATGEAVREALRVILDGPPGGHDPLLPPPRERRWGEPPARSWPTRPHDRYGDESYDGYDRNPEDLDDDPVYRSVPADDGPEERPADEERPGALSRAVAAGCQAASWWLRRHPGRFSAVAAAAVAVAAGVVALVGGRFAAAGSAAAAAALGVLALADAARAVAGLAADAVK